MISALVILTMCMGDTQQTCQDINAGQLRISNQNECWVAAQPLAVAWITEHPGWKLGNVKCQ
jgi:hypothetical protein